MDYRIKEAIDEGYVNTAVGIALETNFEDFSRNDYIKLIKFCYECYLHVEDCLDDLRSEK